MSVSEPSSSKVRPRARARGLAPWTFLVRNVAKTGPLVGVIVLAVLLIYGIVSMMNSIPLSIRTIYEYSRLSLGVTPRGDPEMTPKLRQRIIEAAPVPLERVMTVRVTSAEVRSIVGPWPFPAVGMKPDDMTYYLQRVGSRGIRGRLPMAGQPEALISEPVARNLGLKIGSPLLSPDQQEAYSPYSVRVVGIADTPRWVMLTSFEYLSANHFPPVDVLMVTARNSEDQEKLDAWAFDDLAGEWARQTGARAQVFIYRELESDTDDQFRILYTILNIVIGTLVLVITVMMAMLMNIYQSQRVQEFGLLQALGYSKDRIMARVRNETLIVVAGGWLVGLAIAYGLLKVVEATLMYPRAFAIDTFDLSVVRYTIPVPLAILAVSWLGVWLRFRTFDPVGVVERRLV